MSWGMGTFCCKSTKDLEQEIKRLQAEKEDIGAAIGFDYTEMRKEVERLRGEIAEAKENWCPKAERDNALQEVERLREERDALMEASAELLKERDATKQVLEIREARVEQAFAEVKRLRAALEDIARFGDEVPHGFEAHDLQAIARQALEEKE